MLNLELYKVFHTVAKCGSLTKASRELYISQPAVSQSVKQLEERLGVRLFNRTRKGMELSPSGKLIFEKADEALKLIEEAESAIAETQTAPAGLIRIGATDSIFSHLLADRIAEFGERYPSVKLGDLASYNRKTQKRRDRRRFRQPSRAERGGKIPRYCKPFARRFRRRRKIFALEGQDSFA